MKTNIFGLTFSNFKIPHSALQCLFLSFRLKVFFFFLDFIFYSEDFHVIWGGVLITFLQFITLEVCPLSRMRSLFAKLRKT